MPNIGKISDPMKKRLIGLLLTVLVIGIGFNYFIAPTLPILNGYVAKRVCSCTFISNRSQESIENQDLNFFPAYLASTHIDKSKLEVRSTILGMGYRVAKYRNGIGCTLLSEDVSNLENIELHSRTIQTPTLPKVTTHIQKTPNTLQAILDNLILDPSGQTKALMVIHHDSLISEAYAEGFSRETPMPGWSMNKSIVNALIGIMVKNNMLSINDRGLRPEWLTDKRKAISIENMLRMQSGLKWEEEYRTVTDATNMLYLKKDVVDFADNSSAEFEPGTHWEYSSGTSNLLSGIIRSKLHNDELYWNFPYDSLFAPLGMSSAVMEMDQSGNFIGSSFGFMNTLDWARFGLLYLHEGNWMGKQIFSKEWVEFSTSETSNSNGIYGAHLWLNKRKSAYPDAPEDLFSANGFQGQFVFIIPSYDAVIVRLGLGEWDDPEVNDMLKSILDEIDNNNQ